MLPTLPSPTIAIRSLEMSSWVSLPQAEIVRNCLDESKLGRRRLSLYVMLSCFPTTRTFSHHSLSNRRLMVACLIQNLALQAPSEPTVIPINGRPVTPVTLGEILVSATMSGELIDCQPGKGCE